MSALTYHYQRENSAGTLLVSLAVISLAFTQVAQPSVISQNSSFNSCAIRQEYGYSTVTKQTIAEYNSTTLPQKEGPAMNEKQMKNLKKLDDFSKYPVNWNGYGAPTISCDLIAKMKGLALLLNYQPDIFPTARRSIQFEYEKEDGSYLEFELFNDKLQMYSINSVGTESTSLLDFDAKAINEEINKFYGCSI